MMASLQHLKSTVSHEYNLYLESSLGFENSKESRLKVLFYKKSLLKDIFFWILSIITLGLYPLVISWFSLGLHNARYKLVDDFKLASSVLLTDDKTQKSVVPCKPVTLSTDELKNAITNTISFNQKKVQENVLLFEDIKDSIDIEIVDEVEPMVNKTLETVSTVILEYQCSRYILNPATNSFHCINYNVLKSFSSSGPQVILSIPYFSVIKQRKLIYGQCCIDIEVQPIYKLVANEIFHPFYIFQLAAIALWIWDDYFEYSIAISIITLVSLCTEIFEVYSNKKKLQILAKSVCDVNIIQIESEQHSVSKNEINTDECSYSLQKISSLHLVPGQVIQLKPGMKLPCDLILVHGHVLVDESAITGEPIPVWKASELSHQIYDKSTFHSSLKSSKTILHSGTTIINAKTSQTCGFNFTGEIIEYPLAIVESIGFNTNQGGILKSILHPVCDQRFSFKKETYKFVCVLACLAILISAFTICVSIRLKLHPITILKRALDTFPNAIPPSISAAMTVGCTIAVTKLRRRHDVLCMTPSKINTAGQVNTMIFDKTGTLTEDGLFLEGIIYSNGIYDFAFEKEYKNLKYNKQPESYLTSLTTEINEIPEYFKLAMACCHDVALIDNCYSGDPIELALLNFVECSFSEHSLSVNCQKDRINYQDICQPILSDSFLAYLDSNLPCLGECVTSNRKNPILHNDLESKIDFFKRINTIQNECVSHLNVSRIIKRFEFNSNLKRMSVIVWNRNTHELFIVSKGAPEMISARCRNDSIPLNYSSVLSHYTRMGMRVLAFAIKKISLNHVWTNAIIECETSNSSKPLLRLIQTYCRDEVENNLFFMGFTVFRNNLRSDTKSVIDELTKSKCHCIMSTGDNPQTAVAVARECNLIPDNNFIVLGDAIDIPTDSSSFMNSEQSVIWSIIKLNDDQSITKCENESQIVSINFDNPEPSCGRYNNVLKPYSFSDGLTSTTCSVTGDTFDHMSNGDNSIPHVISSTFSDSFVDYSNKINDSSISDLSDFEIPTESLVNIKLSSNNQSTDKKYIVDEVFRSHLDLNRFLKGKNMKDVIIVLTGTAFDCLKNNHEKLNIPWSSKIKNKKRMFSNTFSSINRIMEIVCSMCNCIKSICRSSGTESKRHLVSVMSNPEIRESSIITFKDTNSQCSNIVPNISIGKDTFSGKEFNYEELICLLDSNSYFVNMVQLKSTQSHIEFKQHGFPVKNYLSKEPVVGIASKKNDSDLLKLSQFEFCLRYCRIYTRMSPDDKYNLVKSLRSLPEKPFIGMCGDGANDCSALACADLGLSLSLKEASIASSFTASKKTIKSCIGLLCESRNALVNSFQCFKYIAISALIQVTSTTLLFNFGTNLTSLQYLWVDLPIVLLLTILMSWTDSSHVLSDRIPLKRLLSYPVALSLLGQTALNILFSIASLALLFRQPFYVPFKPDLMSELNDPESLMSYENTVIFIVSCFQYITTSIAIANGQPWRKHFIYNRFYMLFVILLICVSSLLIIQGNQADLFLCQWLNIKSLPIYFRFMLACIILVNGVILYTFENYIIRNIIVKRHEKQHNSYHYINRLKMLL